MKRSKGTALVMAAMLSIAGYATAQPVSVSPRRMPDACKLLPLSDLTALYPSRPIETKGAELSPISRGPQYVESCQYVLRLPRATSEGDVARFVSLTIVKAGESASESASSFNGLLRLHGHLAADPKNRLAIARQTGIGDEAFLETRLGNLAITARKEALIFTVRLDLHAEDTLANLQALARQAASRWSRDGLAEPEAATARNEKVAIPSDTRVPSVAPVQAWPDACALLVPTDLGRVFTGATIKPPRPMRGQITHEGREQRLETLPKPIACLYDISRPNPAGSQPARLFHQAQVAVKNVAANPELSRRFYQVSEKVAGPLEPLAGLGEEAGIDKLNRITIRKGVFAIEVKVTGGERDPVLHAEARDKALMLGKIAAERLP